MPHLPSGKTPLGERYRKSASVKPGYDVWLDAKGEPASAKSPGVVWKRVKRKQRDMNAGTLRLTFTDDSVLDTSDRGALWSRRLDLNAEQEAGSE